MVIVTMGVRVIVACRVLVPVRVRALLVRVRVGCGRRGLLLVGVLIVRMPVVRMRVAMVKLVVMLVLVLVVVVVVMVVRACLQLLHHLRAPKALIAIATRPLSSRHVKEIGQLSQIRMQLPGCSFSSMP